LADRVITPQRREYLRNYRREWMRARRAAWFKDKVCAQCGSADKLELDHIDPATKETHSIWSWAKERRDVELAKCQALCESCHMDKTKAYLREYFKKPIRHGHVYTYEAYKCRCVDCKTVYAARRATRLSRKKQELKIAA
jgi:5-methylcytosine-specific restriction endonuclease McrA